MKKLLVIVIFFVGKTTFAQTGSSVLHSSLDTLSTLSYKLDSVETSASGMVDSVTQDYRRVTGKVQELRSHYQQKIDSLCNLKLPVEKYTEKIDSLTDSLAQAKQTTEAKIESIKQNASDEINSLLLPPELQTKASQVTRSLDKLNLSTLPSVINTPINLSGLDSSFDKLTQEVDMPSMDDVKDVTENLGSVSDLTNSLTEQTALVQQEVGGVVENANQISQIDKVAENQLKQINAVKGLQQSTGSLPVAGIPSEEEAKQQIVKQVRSAAIDHFAGKQEALQAAIDKMSKYKEKYQGVTSITELLKRRPNAMRGKPFVERLVPGVTLQFQSSSDWWMDVYVSAGYRISGKITGGIGWNQRMAYNFGDGKFNSHAKIYGIRNYGEFRFKKGFIARGEIEWMNAYIPPLASSTTEFGQHECVFGVFTGMKKEYKFLRTVKGNVQVMYNIWDPHDKAPYTDRLNVRMGFEFILKKKKVLG